MTWGENTSWTAIGCSVTWGKGTHRRLSNTALTVDTYTVFLPLSYIEGVKCGLWESEGCKCWAESRTTPCLCVESLWNCIYLVGFNQLQPLSFLMLKFYHLRSKCLPCPLDQINLVLNNSSFNSFFHFLNGYLLNMACAESVCRLQSKEKAKRCLQVVYAWLNIQGTKQTMFHSLRKELLLYWDRQNRLHTFNEAFCGRQNNAPPKDVHVLIPRGCESVRWHGKGEIRLQMELGLLISPPYTRDW